MDLHRDLTTGREPAEVFSWVDDLSRYPEWMRLTHRVDPADHDQDGPAWIVELRASIGPLARSKRLRMVRTVHDPPRSVVFERRERDGRSHSPWILTVTLDERPGAPAGTVVRVHLHYGGRRWPGGVMERVLADEVQRGRARLSEILDGPTH